MSAEYDHQRSQPGSVMTGSSSDAVARDRFPGYDDHRISGDGVEVRALCRHQATVLRISGRLDAGNIERVGWYAPRCAQVRNAVVLDLSRVDSVSESEQIVALLLAVDDACADAAVPWVLVPSLVVEQTLRPSDYDDMVPTATSVPAAMQHLAHLARIRRRVLRLAPSP